MTVAPIRTIEDALRRGFEAEDVRSDRHGVDVDLRRDDEQMTVHLTREDARQVVSRDATPVHAAFE